MKTMKNIILLLLLVNCTTVFAQNRAWQNVFGSVDKVSETYLQELKNASIFKSDNKSIIVSVDDGKSFTNYKSGEKYNKVVFLVNKEKLYATAKIKYERSKYKNLANHYTYSKIEVIPQGDVRYLDNDQLFCTKADMDKKEPYSVSSDATIYNKDGSIKYRKTQSNNNYTTIEAYISKNDRLLHFPIGNGNYKLSENTNLLKPLIFDKTGIAKEFGTLINKTSKGTYKGTAHAGTFQSNNGEIYTGYFAPISGISQGSVLFRERNGKAEWVLVVGGTIEETLSAVMSEKPNVSQLQQQIQVTPYTGNKIYKSDKETLNLFNSADYLGNYSSNPTDGYGVRYHTTGDPTPSKEILMEVGIFGMGKLNGLGYRVKGDAEMRFSKDKPYGLQHNVTVEAGIFSGGVLMKGRTFVLDKIEELNSFWHRNYWVKSPIKGFDYIQTDAIPIDTLQFHEKIPYTDIALRKGNKVFIEKLNRWTNIWGLDEQNRLVVFGDNDNKVILDNTIGNVYFESTESTPVRVNCATTKVVKKYKTVTEDVNWKDSKGRTILTETDRSGYLKPVTIYTSKKTVLDGYETVTCDRCGGTGYYNSYTEEKVIYRLDFASNNLYNKVGNALNNAVGSETTETEISLFGTTEHLQFEAESYLNLFNNEATRTYDHMNAYNKRLQYEWIQSAKNAREIYTAFADLFYLIYQKNPNASYYFITTIHANSYNETVAIVTEKYPEARKYLRTKAQEIQKKK
jgi:hypothetical protein